MSYTKPTREQLQEIAKLTLQSVQSRKVRVDGKDHDISELLDKSKFQTAYYAPDSLLSAWRKGPSPRSAAHPSTIFEFLETSTLAAARAAGLCNRATPIGVLNFASAEQPGGGFINGANAQEESIARSSALYASLMTPTAQQFYNLHSADERGGFYTHAMVYSPHVVVFRDDAGGFLPPIPVDVLTSPAVHAGIIHEKGWEARRPVEETQENIEWVMMERMARILYLFERHKARTLILGSFGTGVFCNDIAMVAQIWAELLSGPRARFAHSFDYVAFAIVDNTTYTEFKQAYESYRT
ncbi:hypothetical protein C8R46DRAFT_1125600 [Mycena filopes]|nr:hypothetical protein C8R46DRAFT_1125600 [Mycena filopes]